MGDDPPDLLEVVPAEVDSHAHAQWWRSRRKVSGVTRAAQAGLVVGLGLSSLIASAEGGHTPPSARVPNRDGAIVGPPTAQAFVGLDVSALNGPRADSLPWRSARGEFLSHCEGRARVLDADVRGLAPGFTYQWVISDPDNPYLFRPLKDIPSIRLRVLFGTGTVERLTPQSSFGWLRLLARIVLAAPLDGSRPLLVVNGQNVEPRVGWVVMAPNELVRLLMEQCS